MTATCRSEFVNFGAGTTEVPKSKIAIYITIFDMIIVFFLWFALLTLHPMIRIVNQEVDDGNLTGEDFGVMLTQKPYADSIDALKGIYWGWAENVLEKEEVDYTDPRNNCLDVNQNNIANVNLGLSNYGYITYMKQMGQLLLQKKRLTHLLRRKNNSEKLQIKTKKKIESLQEKAGKKL